MTTFSRSNNQDSGTVLERKGKVDGSSLLDDKGDPSICSIYQKDANYELKKSKAAVNNQYDDLDESSTTRRSSLPKRAVNMILQKLPKGLPRLSRRKPPTRDFGSMD